MHLGKTGHQELAATVQGDRAERDVNARGGTDLHDAAAAHDDGLVLDRTAAIHRDNGDINERESDRVGLQTGAACIRHRSGATSYAEPANESSERNEAHAHPPDWFAKQTRRRGRRRGILW